MDTFGNDLSSGGVVLSREELIKKRQRSGICPTCGQKLYKKKLFKLEPITITGKVLQGRCLICQPQDPTRGEQLVATCAVVARPPPARALSQPVSRGGGGGGGRRGRPRSLASSMPDNTSMTRVAEQVRSSAVNSARGLRSSVGPAMGPMHEEPSDRSASSNRSNLSPNRRRSDNSQRRGSGDSQPNSPQQQHHQRQRQRENDYNNGALREEGSGGLSRRDSFTRRDSKRQGSFLNRKMPRPSAVFLEGINIDDLWDDGDGGDSDHDDHDNHDICNTATSRDSINSLGSSAKARLNSGERKALQTLNHDDNSFLDIVNIMMLNSTSSTVQNEGLHALSLVHDPEVELLEECAGSCGFEVIVSAMGKCCKDAMAQTNACKVLFIASASGEDLQISIGNAGGIEALIDAMKEFDDDFIVLEGCLLALSNLCIPEESVTNVLEGELVELTVNAMSKNVENCGLQEHGCAVLANLAVHEEARTRIRDCGGCDTVVVSMVVNPMDEGVQCQALVALRNLCVRDDENKVLLANAGAIDVVIQAMQNHRDDSQIQARGSWVLGIIGMNEDNKLYIGENGGADVIIRSMWVHAEDSELQEKACRALWTLSVHRQNRYSMVDVDAIAAVIAAMQNHVALPNIQERGCGVLSNLAANDDDLKIQIVEEGALEVIIMAMVLHGENEMIQERAVALLYKLCIEENIPKMMNSNVSPMMAVVAENFPECEEKASYVLRYLSE